LENVVCLQVLQFLRSCGRARSWSAKQRLQNLWTKKGYDLAFRACGCRCGRGHLKKDLDWTPPPRPVPQAVKEEARPKKKRQRQKQRPALATAVRVEGDADGAANHPRYRAGSASSTCSSGSPPSTASPLAGPKRPTKVQPETPTRSVHALFNLFCVGLLVSQTQ